MMLVRPPMTNLKMTVRADCAVPAYGPLLLSITPFAPLVASWEELAFEKMPALLPELLASEIKQTFLSTNLAVYWLLSSEQPDPHTLSITIQGHAAAEPGVELSCLGFITVLYTWKGKKRTQNA